MYKIKIKKYRAKNHMSQAELSSKSGISQSEISEIETLGRSPSVDTIVKIAIALEVCPHDLLKFNYPHKCNWGCCK